jgi:hypothetical protein
MIYQFKESFLSLKFQKKSGKKPNYLLDWFTKEDAIHYPEITRIFTFRKNGRYRITSIQTTSASRRC